MEEVIPKSVDNDQDNCNAISRIVGFSVKDRPNKSDIVVVPEVESTEVLGRVTINEVAHSEVFKTVSKIRDFDPALRLPLTREQQNRF